MEILGVKNVIYKERSELDELNNMKKSNGVRKLECNKKSILGAHPGGACL